jgi:hypothetical protein
MTAPMSSPLRVRQRKGRIWAEDAAGQVVIDGRTREHWPERYVAQTASGTHRVAARVETGPDRYLPIVDAGGREIGRIITRRRQDWVLQLATGETATVTDRGGLFSATNCTVGDLSTAVAPRLAPQRYITLTLADSVLGRPDRDALAVALAWISEMTIASRISDAGGGD